MLFPKTIAQALGLPVLLFLFPFLLSAQLVCDACLVALPDTLPADTIFLQEALSARVGERYAEAISFRVPRTTTPVAANDPNVPAGIAISSFTVKNVTNLPPGLSWQVSRTRFELPDETDGCIRFCGTPLQAGLYNVEVVVTARVLVVDQTASFTFPLLIEPAESVTEGFTVVNDVGCGTVQAGFVNNVPSLGQPGFSYRWDFGNGNMSLAENPGDQLYSAPGEYPVDYQAIIDTTGYFLTNVRVELVGCEDPFNNAPDLQLKVFDPDGVEVFSSGVLRDTRPPVDFNLNLEVAEGNYLIGVYDDDEGIFGGDKTCGAFDFNRLSEGVLTDTEARISVRVIHPVDTVHSRDTITVFAQPAPPQLSREQEGPLCSGDTVLLWASYPEAIQWYRDSILLPEGGAELFASASGQYTALYTSPEGCQAVSEALSLDFSLPPPPPVLAFERNLLYLADSIDVQESYRLDWFLDGALLDSGGASAICTSASGVHELRLTDEDSGCVSAGSLTTVYDPAFPDCTSATDIYDRLVASTTLFPNPATGPLQVRLQLTAPSPVVLRLLDARGRLVRVERSERVGGQGAWLMDVSALPPGLYMLQVRVGEGQRGYRLLVH